MMDEGANEATQTSVIADQNLQVRRGATNESNLSGGVEANAPTNIGSDMDDGLAQALIESQRDERERNVARAREDKDLRRALEMSKQDALPTDKDATVVEDEEEDEDEDDSDYSTTGWTSSEDDDEKGEDEGSGEHESEEAQRQRVAERMRVLEAAGILVVQGANRDSEAKGDLQQKDVEASKRAENLLLHRRPTNKKPKPERPERTIGEMRKRKQRPSRPARPPPPPPKEREPELQMEDAYDRFVKLAKHVQATQKTHNEVQLGALPSEAPSSPPAQAVSPPSSTSTPTLSSTVASAGSGLLSTIKSMSSRRGGAGSPNAVERKSTPTISGPMMMRTHSPSIGSPQPSLGSTASLAQSGVATQSADDVSVASTGGASASSWSGLIGADALRDIPEQERKRQEAIFELISTESSHVRDVQIIVDVFFNAMQPLLQPKAATVIFGNIEEVLLAAVSLLSDFEARQRNARLYITQIGDILETHMADMSVYIPYCVNQETASHILATERSCDPQLDGLLTRLRAEHPSARGLDLSHFLLVPMQRLTRYPLLFGQILKYTDQDDNPDEVAALRRAMSTAQRLLDSTNEAIRQRQTEERLAMLSERINASTVSATGRAAEVKLDLTHQTRWMGPRRILRDEVLTKQKSGRRITVVLCNDIVLLLSGLSGASEADEYLYRMPMPLEELVVRDVPAGLTGRDDLSFQLVHQGREKVNLRCASARACHAWMHSIDSARADCLAAANKTARGGKRDNIQ